MTARGRRIGPFAIEGPYAWAFPSGLLLLAGTVFCYIVLLFYGVFGHVWPCDVEGRFAASFVTAAGIGAACLGAAAVEGAAARLIAGALAGVVLCALAWWGVAAVFAPHC